MTKFEEKSAVISVEGKYRYELRRQLSDSKKTCTFIMLNPSTADAENDDPTIRRCIAFAKRVGAGQLIVVNLFAYRATEPKAMLSKLWSEGRLNNAYIMRAAREAQGDHLTAEEGGFVICAWGAHGGHRDRDIEVCTMLTDDGMFPDCIGVTKDGFPRHPLYVKGDAEIFCYMSRGDYYGKDC